MKRGFFYSAVFLLLTASILCYGRALGDELASSESIEAPPSMSDFIEVWTDAVDNIHPAVAFNPLHQEYLVVWVTKQEDYTWDLWGRRLHADGSPVADGWFNIDSVPGVRFSSPAISYNPQDDQYLVVYTSQASLANYNIWGRVLEWDGEKHSRLYLDSAQRRQDAASVAYNTQEPGYLLAYHSEQPSGDYYLELRALGVDGIIQLGYTIVSPTGEFRTLPCVVYNPAGNDYFVVYSLEFDVGPPKVIGRTVSADLSQIMPEFEYSDGSNFGLYPAAALGVDEYLVSWWNPSYSFIAGRRVNLEGVPLGPSQGLMIAIGSTNILRSYPKVARTGLLGYLVAWNSFDTETYDVGDVLGRFVGFGANQPLDDSFAIDARPNFQGGVDLACTPGGTCLLVGTHNPSAYPEGDLDISARLILMDQVFLPLALR